MSKTFQPCGLHNKGNTCYFNSLIQNLYQTKYFVQELKNMSIQMENNTSEEQQERKSISELNGTKRLPRSNSRDIAPHSIVWNLMATALAAVYKAGSHSVSLLKRNPVLVVVMPICFCFFLFRIVAEKWYDWIMREPQPPVPVTVTLSELFHVMDSKSGGKNCDPESVLNSVRVRSPRFRGYFQQDSHEFMRHLLDGVRQEERILNRGSNCLSMVDKVFGGHFRTLYTCSSCQKPYFVYEPFLDISLPVATHEEFLNEIADHEETERMYYDRPSSEVNIEFWLKVFTRKENLGKQYICSYCNKERTGDDCVLSHCTKQTLICDPPAILCVHLKRFKQVKQDFVKIDSHVNFSQILDLKPYLSAECTRVGQGQENVSYSLYGLVVHSGSVWSGHYVAYVKSQENELEKATIVDDMFLEKSTNVDDMFLQTEELDWRNLPHDKVVEFQKDQSVAPININQNKLDSNNWYYCSDSSVRAESVAHVFQQQAYLLFYKRIC